MLSRIAVLWLCLAVTLGSGFALRAQSQPVQAAESVRPAQLTGLVFGDYYAFAAHHDARFARQNGAWLRRVYLTYDREVSRSWSSRVRLELNSPSLQETQDRLRPYLKDASLRFTRGRHSLFFGLSPTPPFDLSEAHWGLRHVEKMPADLHRLIETRDMGLGARGRLGRFGYAAMLGTGSGVRNEVDRGKRTYLALFHEPLQSVQVELYGDFEQRSRGRDVATLQAFAGWRGAGARVGALYLHQAREQGEGRPWSQLDLFSGWGIVRLNPRLSALSRVDRSFAPDSGGAQIAYAPFDPSAKSTLWLAGLEFAPLPAVRFTPNVEWITYDGVTPTPKSDVGLRLTFSWTF